MATQAKMTIHPETSCSQCGRSFGPGKHGFSHCANHEYAAETTAVIAQARLRAIKLHRDLLDADLITAARSADRAINAMDAELARRGEYLAAIAKPSPLTRTERFTGAYADAWVA